MSSKRGSCHSAKCRRMFLNQSINSGNSKDVTEYFKLMTRLGRKDQRFIKYLKSDLKHFVQKGGGNGDRNGDPTNPYKLTKNELETIYEAEKAKANAEEAIANARKATANVILPDYKYNNNNNNNLFHELTRIEAEAKAEKKAEEEARLQSIINRYMYVNKKEYGTHRYSDNTYRSLAEKKLAKIKEKEKAEEVELARLEAEAELED